MISLSAVEDSLFNVRALSDRGKDWQQYISSDTRYYKKWQQKLGDDTSYPCNLNNILIFNEPAKLVLSARSIREILITEDLSLERNYYAIATKDPKNESIADFQNTISSNNRIFLANGNNRNYLLSDSKDLLFESVFPNSCASVLWHFSSVVWWI